MVLLDSNIVIYLSKRLIDVDAFFKAEEEYAISVITYMEVLGFAFESEEEEAFVKKLLSFFKTFYLDHTIVDKVIALRKCYTLKLPDAIICATAIANHATLYSNDKRLTVIGDLTIQHYSCLDDRE